jgi:hypothetical protein
VPKTPQGASGSAHQALKHCYDRVAPIELPRKAGYARWALVLGSMQHVLKQMGASPRPCTIV